MAQGARTAGKYGVGGVDGVALRGSQAVLRVGTFSGPAYGRRCTIQLQPRDAATADSASVAGVAAEVEA